MFGEAKATSQALKGIILRAEAETRRQATHDAYAAKLDELDVAISANLKDEAFALAGRNAVSATATAVLQELEKAGANSKTVVGNEHLRLSSPLPEGRIARNRFFAERYAEELRISTKGEVRLSEEEVSQIALSQRIN